MARRRSETAGGLALLNEAFEVLRAAPGLLLSYYIGAVPFMIALATFWSAMSYSPFADMSLAPASLGLALLFVWMKAWQARYAAHAEAVLAGEAEAEWGAPRSGAITASQAFCHAVYSVLLPMSLVTVLLFPSVYAASQLATAMGLEKVSVRDLLRDSWREGFAATKEAWIIVWLACPLLPFVAAFFMLLWFPTADRMPEQALAPFMYFTGSLGILAIIVLMGGSILFSILLGSVLVILLGVLQLLLGLDVALSLGSVYSSTGFAITCAVVYLVLDPVVKMAFVLRHFQVQSQRSGLDLLAALRRLTLAAAAAAILGVCLFTGTASAQEEAPLLLRPESLEQVIDEELSKQRYTWRMPREALELAEDSPIVQFAEWLQKRLATLMEWIAELLRRIFGGWGGDGFGAAEGGLALMSWARVLLIAVIIVLVLVLGVALIRWWRVSRQRPPQEEVAAEVVVPDVADESVTADALPEDEWMALALELIDKGDYRLAARAVFLSVLARLNTLDLIRLARFKTNMDYERELRRRGRAAEESLPPYSRARRVFEGIWYGNRPAGPEAVEALRAERERLVRDGAA